MEKHEKNRLKYPCKENTDVTAEKILYILDRLKDYRDPEKAESLCLMEITKNDNPMAWFIMALIKLEEGQYRSFGTCLHNAVGDMPAAEYLPEIRKTVEHIDNYLEKTYAPVCDFLDGYQVGGE